MPVVSMSTDTVTSQAGAASDLASTNGNRIWPVNQIPWKNMPS